MVTVPTPGSTPGTSRSSRWRSTGEIARAQGWWWRGSRASRKAPDCAQQHSRVAACAFCRAQSSYLTCVCWPGLSDVRQSSCVSCPACHCSNPPRLLLTQLAQVAEQVGEEAAAPLGHTERRRPSRLLAFRPARERAARHPELHGRLHRARAPVHCLQVVAGSAPQAEWIY